MKKVIATIAVALSFNAVANVPMSYDSVTFAAESLGAVARGEMTHEQRTQLINIFDNDNNGQAWSSFTQVAAEYGFECAINPFDCSANIVFDANGNLIVE